MTFEFGNARSMTCSTVFTTVFESVSSAVSSIVSTIVSSIVRCILYRKVGSKVRSGRPMGRSSVVAAALLTALIMTGVTGAVQAQQEGADRARAVESAAVRLFPSGEYRSVTHSYLSSCAPARDDRLLATPFATFRLGFSDLPVPTIDGGLDVTFPRLGIAKNWAGRLDLDASARLHSPSFGSTRDAVIALTACQVYTPGGVNRGGIFVGGGIGPSFGAFGGIGGKVFIGTNVTRVLSFELDGQFPGDSSGRIIFLIRGAAL